MLIASSRLSADHARTIIRLARSLLGRRRVVYVLVLAARSRSSSAACCSRSLAHSHVRITTIARVVALLARSHMRIIHSTRLARSRSTSSSSSHVRITIVARVALDRSTIMRAQSFDSSSRSFAHNTRTIFYYPRRCRCCCSHRSIIMRAQWYSFHPLDSSLVCVVVDPCSPSPLAHLHNYCACCSRSITHAHYSFDSSRSPFFTKFIRRVSLLLARSFA